MPQMSRRHLVLTAAALPFARPAFSDARDPLGQVLALTGTGTLSRDGVPVPLAPGLALHEGDIAATGEDGLALLLLDEDMRINLGLSSSIDLVSFVSEVGGAINLGGALVFDRPEDRPPSTSALSPPSARSACAAPVSSPARRAGRSRSSSSAAASPSRTPAKPASWPPARAAR